MRTILLSLILLLSSIPVAAATKPADDFVEIKAGTAITIRPDRAYLLFRTNWKDTRVYKGISPVFLRIPTAAEMERYEAAKRAAFAKAKPDVQRRGEENFNFVYDEIRNLHSVSLGRALEKLNDGTIMLVEALPGNYVLYGWGNAHLLHTCLCLGTVSFPAEAGKITDLGTLLAVAAWEPSSIPELKDVTGWGPTVNGHVVLWASAVRPATSSTSVPSALTGKPIVPANYRATGKFVSPFAFGINRLAPMPGVLGYDGGKVLDLISNTVAENHYH